MLIESSTLTSPSSLFDEWMLNRLRYAHIKARLILNRIEYTRVALRRGWTSGEGAAEMLAEVSLPEVNLLDFVVGTVGRSS
jgi:hypothetical protein